MDVISPDLLWVGDRCYRLPILNSSENFEIPQKSQDNESETAFHYMERNNECEEDETCDNVESLSNNRYKLNLSIPQTFWSKIIGSKGVTKKRIECDTNTIIIIPRQMEHGDVIIKGTSKKDIILAKKNIESVVSSLRQKLDFTHFISIPMNNDEIRKNFLIFKDQVLKLFGKDRGVDDSIFQNPNKLHLTIGTLVLTDQNERNLAEKLLQDVFEKSIKPLIDKQKHLLVEMKGIEYMNDDPAEVHVLYGKITSKGNESLLQTIANHIYEYFSHYKLLKSDHKEEVKLHVTLMNTVFREEETDELDLEAESFNKIRCIKRTRRTFNAVNILQNFHEFYFGQEEIKSIQLSVRFSTAKDGYYKNSYTIKF